MPLNHNLHRRAHSQSRKHAWLALLPLQRVHCAYLIGVMCRWPVWLIKHAVCKGNCRTSCPPRSLSSSSKPQGIPKQPQLRTACKPSFIPTALLCKPSASCHGNSNTAEMQAQIPSKCSALHRLLLFLCSSDAYDNQTKQVNQSY